MKTNYYIITRGALYAENGNIYFDPNEGSKSFINKYTDDESNDIMLVDSRRSIPIENTSSICCFANVQFDTSLYSSLAKNNIPLIIFDNYTPVGTFYNNFSQSDGDVSILQSLHYISKSKRLTIARKLVHGSIANKIVNLVYYNNRNKLAGFQVQRFAPIIQQLYQTKDVNSIMLLEAQAQKIYFAHFNLIFKNPEFSFYKREYNPPPDPVNALISFVYALLYSTLFTEIASTFLNPFISYLHEPGSNRLSLIWDLSEIFKPIICDKLVFKLINGKSIKPDMFDYTNGKCLLNKTGSLKVVTAFNNKMKTTIFNRETQKQQSYRSIIRYEYYKFIRHLKNEEEYKPIKMWW